MRARPPLLRFLPLLPFVPILLAPVPARAAEEAEPDGPTQAAEDAEPHGPSGREIYERVLANRFQAYRQTARLVSGDRAGNEQESRMTVLWKSFRDEQGAPRNDVLSKTKIRYTHPFDLRFSGYLLINNHTRSDDQFVYLNSRRRIRRVNLRGEPVLGSDFSFEDVVPRELEDADYRRLADELLDGRPVWVVEVTPRPGTESEYSRFRSWVDRERDVVLRTLYWDTSGVQVKELRAPAEEVRAFDGVWVPMRTEMRNLLTGGYTVFHVEQLAPDPEVADGEFDPRRLESH
ncbi:MAG TPA: outer membrane lipoprotein-sorting protein [Actinopolymorphaceae bacterium]